MHPGTWGGIVGGGIGLIGGILGTYFGIKSARGPRERRFAIKAAVLMWAGVSAYVALMLWLSSPFRSLLWVPYALVLCLSIVWMNRRLARIRQEESQT